MKSVFDNTTRDELITRISTLNESSIARWGKMNVYQMLKHCRLWTEWVSGSTRYKRIFLSHFFGKIALKSVLKDEAPLGRNSSTISVFRINEKEGDIESEKRKWIALIQSHEHFSNPDFVHVFFGKMTKEQIGYLAYKHADHHLRQFGS